MGRVIIATSLASGAPRAAREISPKGRAKLRDQVSLTRPRATLPPSHLRTARYQGSGRVGEGAEEGKRLLAEMLLKTNPISKHHKKKRIKTTTPKMTPFGTETQTQRETV